MADFAMSVLCVVMLIIFVLFYVITIGYVLVDDYKTRRHRKQTEEYERDYYEGWDSE